MNLFGLGGRTSDLVQDLNGAYAASLQRERIAGINNAWSYYTGTHPKPLKVDPKRADDNTIVNLCRLVVDKSVAALFGQGVEFDIEEEEEGGEAEVKAKEEAEAYLKGVWKENHGAILQHAMGVNGAVTGDVFLKLRVDPARAYPRIINLDPATVYALWNPDDIEEVVEYRIEWMGTDPNTGKMRSRRQTITKGKGSYWDIIDWVSEANRSWVEIGRDRWPYEWCPVFHCQNLPAPNQFYGVSDITRDVTHINDRLNFDESSTARTMRLHAYPKTWGRGFNADQMSMAPDEVVVIPGTDGVLQNLEMASDMSANLEHAKTLREAFFTLTRTPEVALGRLEGIGDISGVALQILFAPLIEKTNTKQLLYGELLEDLNHRLLELGGFAPYDVCARWPNVTPTNPKADAETALLRLQVGISTETALEEIGVDAAREAERKEAEQEAAATIGDKLLQQFNRGQSAEAAALMLQPGTPPGSADTGDGGNGDA